MPNIINKVGLHVLILKKKLDLYLDSLYIYTIIRKREREYTCGTKAHWELNPDPIDTSMPADQGSVTVPSPILVRSRQRFAQ